MRFLRPSILAIAALAALVSPSAARADTLDQTVRGRALAVDAGSKARGEFRIESRRTDKETRETIGFTASKLDATLDGLGHLPAYHAVLVDATGATSADFGLVKIDKGGHAWFRFDSRFDAYPVGVSTLADFGGGKFELQKSGAAVLRGTIPAFAALGAPRTADSWTFYRGTSKLVATVNGGAGRGALVAEATAEPHRTSESVRIDVRLLGTAGNPFTVVAIDSKSVETTLGTITTKGGLGSGKLFLSAKNGTIAGGGVLALSDERIEIRNAVGTPVLTGTFPTVK